MKKVIGIVGEGPLDQIVLRTAIDRITGERNMYRYIQPEHNSSPEGYRQHLTDLLRGLLEVDSSEKRVVFVIPCDSTDAWIVAAYDDVDNIENVEDPWTNIIAHKKEYHGIRVHGHKKRAAVFRNFMPKLSSEWDCVTKKCASAKLLDEAVRNS